MSTVIVALNNKITKIIKFNNFETNFMLLSLYDSTIISKKIINKKNSNLINPNH